MIFRIDFESDDARESVQKFLADNEINADSQRAVQSSNRYSAYEAEFTLRQNGQDYGFLIYAVEYGGRVYNFLNYTSQSAYSDFRPLFRRSEERRVGKEWSSRRMICDAKERIEDLLNKES